MSRDAWAWAKEVQSAMLGAVPWVCCDVLTMMDGEVALSWESTGIVPLALHQGCRDEKDIGLPDMYLRRVLSAKDSLLAPGLRDALIAE
eukprot:2779183-Amphidinium_carterae.1